MRCPTIVNNTAFKYLFPVAFVVAICPAQAKMYKWVDAQGNVQYSDTLPPAAAGRGNAEISKTGQTVKKTESAEEKRARLVREAEAAQKKKVADEQARRDRALLSTYTTEQEIDLSRDRALEHHNLVIKSAQIRLKPVMASAEGMARNIRALKAANKPVPPYTQQQFDAKLAEAEDIRNLIKTNEETQIAVRARYEADKLRFRELKGLPPPSAASTQAPQVPQAGTRAPQAAVPAVKPVAPASAKPATKP